MKVPYTPESFRESRMVRAYPEWFGIIPNGSGNPRMIRDPELFEETTAYNLLFGAPEKDAGRENQNFRSNFLLAKKI